jgi:hypothetical protein
MSYVAPLALASAMGCIGETGSSPEAVGHALQASTEEGVTASFVVNSKNSTTYQATFTVKNGSPNPASNWQVAVNLNDAYLMQTGAPSTVGAEASSIGGNTVFAPNSSGTVLSPGKSATFSITGTITGSNYLPTIVSVDGVANGTAGAGNKADGVDHIARAVATGALNLALAYENHKLANDGDSEYANYDGLIWSGQSFVISGSQIAFDPKVPGYKFVPTQAIAALEAMQDNPSVASYLTAGLTSCFADTSGGSVYMLKAGALKGFTYPGPTSGTLPAYSPAGATDTFTTTGAAANGAEKITITMKSSSDYSFGILTSAWVTQFANSSAVTSKYLNGNQASCSPFNGSGGGVSNPALIITLNGNTIPPRYQNVGTACNNNPCTSIMVIDPVPYATPGPYYNSAGLVGPQPNPFGFDPTQTAATVDHAGQWATTTSQSGSTVYGAFTSPIVHRGVTTGYAWQQD